MIFPTFSLDAPSLRKAIQRDINKVVELRDLTLWPFHKRTIETDRDPLHKIRESVYHENALLPATFRS
jgi:hypothetical protein